MKHITAYSKNEAWNIANSIFPTDYEYDQILTMNAGYPIYGTTVIDRPFIWISDLNNRLELNLDNCETIWIDIEDRPQWGYDGQY